MSRTASFVRAFLVSVLGTGLSRILGAVRDIAIAAIFGAGAGSDAFWIAFTVPNVFRRFVADEGLTGALIPAVAKSEEQDGLPSARVLANTVLTALLLANLVLCGVGMFWAEGLVYLFAAPFAEDPEKFALTVTMTRWMFPFVTMVSLVSFFEGLLNHRGHFFVPKVAPGLVSAGIAGSAWLLHSRFSEPIYALVVGVLVGGAAHVLVNLPPLLRHWGRIGLGLAFDHPRFRAAAWEMSKVIAIGVLAQLNIIVLRQLAAMVGDGAITRYWYATRMIDLSQGVIAVAVGSALLPQISAAVAAADWDTFRSDLVRAVRLTAFVLLPASAVLLTFATPVTSVLFRRGAYTWVDVQWTATTLRFLVPFMLGLAGVNVLKKVYFALDRRNPLFVFGGLGVIATFGLGWFWVEEWGIVGLAAALSAATCLQLTGYVLYLRLGLSVPMGLGQMVRPLAKMALASLPVAVWLGGLALLGDWPDGLTTTNGLIVGGGLTVAVGLYLGGAWMLGLEELTRVIARLRRRGSA